jgi:hypothetical protein
LGIRSCQCAGIFAATRIFYEKKQTGREAPRAVCLFDPRHNGGIRGNDLSQAVRRLHALPAGRRHSHRLRHLVLPTVADTAEHPDGVAYAIWSGVGIVLITVIAWTLLDHKLEVGERSGMALIIAGVVVPNLFSNQLQA